MSASGHIACNGHNYHVGEALIGKTVGLCRNHEGATELHFAKVYLGNLAYDSEGGRFRPSAYIARPRKPSNPLTTPNLDYQI